VTPTAPTPQRLGDAAHDAGAPRLSPWFGVTGLLLLATLLAAAFVQARQYSLLNSTVQYQDDYLVLNLYQVEMEYLRLREQLRKDLQAPDSAALQLRYDIFVSRVTMLGNDRARRLLGSSGKATTLLRDLENFTRRADLYLGSDPPGHLSPQAAQALLTDLEALNQPIHQIMLDATHQVAAQVTDRQDKVRNHNQIGLALTGFLLAMVMVFAGITLGQMRKLEQRRSRLQRLADQLRDARIEAEAASDAKSEFLADMSHELRTPLHGLLGMLSLVRESPRDLRTPGWLLTADESAQHLQRLLDDILDLSKLSSDVLTLAPSAVNLQGLLREIRSLLQPAAAAKGLGLQIEIDAALPAHVRLEATRVRQVLFNLLSNAIKFSDAGTIVLKCRHGAPLNDGRSRLEFSVRDSGIGMDRDTLAHLFQRHGRATDGRAARLGGSGLGLAISRNLARLMGGEIVVSSTPGTGSVFCFRCPLLPVAATEAITVPAATLAARPLHVLVAEDHPVNRMYLAALLARLGHQVRLVENGLLAVQAVQESITLPAFDLVLMDVHMPVMDGVAATQAIRALPEPVGSLCVVAITADVFADTQQRCLDAGVSEVLTKPLTLDGLRTVLQRRFAGSSLVPSPSTRPVDAAMVNTGLLDRATLHNVHEVMGAAQVPTIYSDFFAQAEDAARRMRNAMRDADTEALRRSAHAIKGAALTLGMTALAEVSALLSRDASQLAAAPLALAVQRFEEITAATRALCASEDLLH
jgi:signal transduction histidine kinase/CheY-like chemotaxis protein/HPt (histidine-containing phosphotransfer) domain-containing protein